MPDFISIEILTHSASKSCHQLFSAHTAQAITATRPLPEAVLNPIVSCTLGTVGQTKTLTANRRH